MNVQLVISGSGGVGLQNEAHLQLWVGTFEPLGVISHFKLLGYQVLKEPIRFL